MTEPFMFEKPLGMRDTLPVLYETKREATNSMQQMMERWGYYPIETPALEYYDTVGDSSAILDQQLFKLLDQQGHTLVLRPDMTAPIARVASSSLKDQPLPLRLSYCANLFRAQQHEGGRPAEFEQLGVELVGDPTASADAEVIALMAESLKAAGLTDFKLAIGHIGYVNALLADIVGKEERAAQLRRYLYEKNFVGFKQHVKTLPVSSVDRDRLLRLLKLRGGIETLDEARTIVNNGRAAEALDNLQALYDALEAYDLTDYITFDLNLVMHMDYYTGVVFEGYGSTLGFPLSSGGRYDELLEKFDRPAQATGFGIRVDRLVEALGATKAKPEETLILFSSERRKEALTEAAKLRGRGEVVVLQDVAGAADLDGLTAAYQHVLSYIGQTQGEGARDE
ncbi:ATP phosphoribosyltransferase regulatory subunit [Salsuginibacillus halophilus]|uniref:ATP phosphoribosyltransferase regulatory subunit n=1 Tax=Salsuginibacillus halophilus TaxID=517424 RepID=A0A2P8H9B4_9BACI|nr:ATP phosphoribosyltransferase regulatory subunit [Salsuginibacillus halophilus]PSL42759.1 ATP phosphoribosyltransferase regulatory subunit [Salsuginibacillus halophilus]